MFDKSIAQNFKGLHDATLREGDQSLLFSLTDKQQLELVKLLGKDGFNIDTMEVNIPINPKVKKLIQKIKTVPGRPPLISLIRNKYSDLKSAIESQVDGVSILCTADQDRLNHMNISFKDHVNELEQIIGIAKAHNLFIRVAVEDFFRIDKKRAYQMYDLASKLSVNRIAVPDTTGAAFPWEVEHEIQELRKVIPASVDIDVHFHSNVGNVFSAIKAGANYVDTTLLGLGEQTGITALSSVIYHLLLTYPTIIEHRYRLNLLTYIEQKFAKMLKISVPPNLITSENAFTHKAGIHIDAILKHGPEKYETINPTIIGQKRKFIIESHISGKTTEKQIKKAFPDSIIIKWHDIDKKNLKKSNNSIQQIIKPYYSKKISIEPFPLAPMLPIPGIKQ